jgi:hypothetical protein
MPDSIYIRSSNRSWLKFQVSIASKLDLLIAATMDEPFTCATGNTGAVTTTFEQFIDMHMKFCVDLQDIRENQLLGAASVRETTDGLKKKLDGELENLFRPLLEQAMRADMELEQAMRARLASAKYQRSRSRSRSRSRAGNGSCKDNGKGKDKGNDTRMGKRGGKGRGKGMDRCSVVDATSSPDFRSDDDTDAGDGEWEWLERDATVFISQYIARDPLALVRACLKRGFGKGLRKGDG